MIKSSLSVPNPDLQDPSKNRVVGVIGRFGETAAEEVAYLFPDFGPVDIPDYQQFLEKSKEHFFQKWDSLKEKEGHDNNFRLTDFKKLRLIGSGSFSHVYVVNNKQTGQRQAMKAILKKTVIDLRQVENTRTEKLVLQCTNCPFTLRLDYFFKDNSYLYFIVPFIRGGALIQHLHRLGKFDEVSAMFYLAQVILALEYLHYLDIVYRDLKPENILIDHTGYIKLTDFGLCKLLRNGRTYSFCGTLDILAPEIILSQGYGKAVDWWAVGVLAFELTSGYPPFKDASDTKKLNKIVLGKYKCPPFLSSELKHLISQALQQDLSMRYGNLKGGVNDFKNHQWFKPLNWQAVVCKKVTPTYLPQDVYGLTDKKNSKEYNCKSLQISDKLEYGNEFDDF